MTERERMNAGLVYDPGDDEIMTEQAVYAGLVYEYNMTRPSDFKRLDVLLKKMLGAVGNPCRVMREIGERDREYFYGDEKTDWENLYPERRLRQV